MGLVQKHKYLHSSNRTYYLIGSFQYTLFTVSIQSEETWANSVEPDATFRVYIVCHSSINFLHSNR